MGKEDGFSVGNAVGLSVGTPGTESRRRRCDIPGVESPYDSASAYEYENSKTSEKPAYVGDPVIVGLGLARSGDATLAHTLISNLSVVGSNVVGAAVGSPVGMDEGRDVGAIVGTVLF